ncbi:ABC transporter permease [Rhodovulum adriaticum]|uniref:Putative ABC transport system permease protein n=1 Tax=Rhodovulum adriaticum TaxID=35804 RepID=A0A4V2SL32_RHOAD|nr:FtsX-like permease family protein [Rhodovulum adriaticum]MBK1635560.1 drug:proton antiporter [Rhodovulum adriaticum]TCP21806.1 putative ABC transport system permease protein [Rhodovulum adriaticum]
MTLPVAARIARRELRGGLRGFYVFLACLALGVAAIAAVGSVRESITAGLQREGAVLLGGNAEMSFTYRYAEDAERAWMARTAETVSEIVDFRSMVVVDRDGVTERGLTQVKGVDGAYPLFGQVELDPAVPLADALAGNGAVMERVLADRLGLRPGDTFRLGTGTYEFRAVLTREPDGAGDGFGLGPRLIVRTQALQGSGLLEPGTLFETKYRLALPPVADLPALEAEAEDRFADNGMRWRDARNGAPGMTRFVERLGSFLVLVGLAGLAVGGVGVSAAVRAYLEGKTAVIATLKTLGAESRTILAAYLIQIGALAALGIVIGLVLGALLPLAFAPLIQAQLPVPAEIGIAPGPLAEAALYGVLTALVFTLWPLARTEEVRAGALFRDAVGRTRVWPRPRYLVAILALAGALIGVAAWFSGVPALALWSAFGILAALGVLVLAAVALRWGARRAARARIVRGRTALRLALGAVGGPAGETTSVVLSLGLGLSILAAVGQIDANLRSAISQELPEIAPSYYIVDIQPNQLDGVLDRLQGDAGVSKVQTAPMLRGIITRINGQPAREVAGDHWVVTGDRGVTYAATPPEGTIVNGGEWWPADYDGPPVMSFSDEEAEEIGLKLGDDVTVNILGRDITAKVTSFRDVDFSTAGIGFVIAMNPGALQGAPHTHIATIYAEPQAEAAILRDLASAYPNITAIRVRDAIDRVAEVLDGLAAAIAYGAAATLVTGLIVLIGAAAAGERARVFEAAVLKTVGAVRGQVLAYFALRSALLGAAAGSVAIVAGGVAGWAVMEFVMMGGYAFEPVSALAIVLGGALATLAAGLGFAWRPLAARPARVLRARE